MIGLLGIACIVISMWDRFASSDYRVYRACKFFYISEKQHNNHMLLFSLVLFITFGVFGFIPTCHFILRFGFEHAFTGTVNTSI